MTAAIVKIHSGIPNIEKEILTLSVDFLQGKAGTGDYIFLKQHWFSIYPFQILQAKKNQGNSYELTVQFPEMEWMWKDRIEKHLLEEDATSFCGISPEQYHALTLELKISYFLSMVDLLSTGRVSDFMKSHFLLAAQLLPEKISQQAGLSKFGGLPMAGADLAFPKDQNGLPAIFIGQVHIRELSQWIQATKEFSKDGVLYFFATVNNYEGHHSMKNIVVQYSDQIADAKEITLPAELARFGTLPEANMRVFEEINVPPAESSLWEGNEKTQEERNAYWYLETILGNYNYFSDTKILGHPNQIQGCILLETELKNSREGWFHKNYKPDDKEELIRTIKACIPRCKDWRVLIEFESSAFTELSHLDGALNEGMDGRYYVMIRQQDLDQMNFDHIETVYQCT